VLRPRSPSVGRRWRPDYLHWQPRPPRRPPIPAVATPCASSPRFDLPSSRWDPLACRWTATAPRLPTPATQAAQRSSQLSQAPAQGDGRRQDQPGRPSRRSQVYVRPPVTSVLGPQVRRGGSQNPSEAHACIAAPAVAGPQAVPLRESESNCEDYSFYISMSRLHVRHELLPHFLLFRDCYDLYITAAIGKSSKNKYLISPSREATRRADLTFDFVPDLAEQRSASTSRPHPRIRAEQERNPLILPYTRSAFSLIVLMYR
jgi:hypothetical protein